MRDCSNAEMRDRLPELMHDRLEGAALAAVRGHVDGCADCGAELALLHQVRTATRAPRVDASRIVAALPRYRSVPAWRRAFDSVPLRAAAAIVLLLGGFAVVKRSPEQVPSAPAPAQTQTAATYELGIGDSFQDLSDSDLAAVLSELAELEAVTPDANEELLLPIAARAPGGGGGA